jgi:hypothetical protein
MGIGDERVCEMRWSQRVEEGMGSGKKWKRDDGGA